MSDQAAFVATAAETRRLEELAVATGASWPELMERAGTGVADVVSDRLQQRGGTAVVLVLVGPGNNGGDGLVAARLLHDRGAGVTLYVWKRRQNGDPNWLACRERGIAELRAEDDEAQHELYAAAQDAGVVIDALLGTGVSRPLEPLVARIVETINDVRAARRGATPLVVAVDVPTGINADSGALMGSAIEADLTVATGIRKRGHVLSPGRQYAGTIAVASIGLDLETEEFNMPESLSGQAMRRLLPARPADLNKGTFGKVLVIAGAGRYPGAAFLSASGAMRAGAGLTTLACGRSIFGALAASLHEATFLPLPEADWGVLGLDAAREIAENTTGYHAWIVGPGLGREDETLKFLQRLLRMETPEEGSGIGFFRSAASAQHVDRKAGGRPVGFGRVTEPAAEAKDTTSEPDDPDEALPPVVLDADALFLLSQVDDWWTRVPESQLILTPHPGEMARLLKLDDAKEVNGDRIGAALRAAEEWKQYVVLKGAETIIAAPDGKASIGPAGNPALATAGTGDVLAGVIGGLLAQGLEPFDAARLGVWLHAAAGLLVRDEVGEAGAVAGDLLPRLPRAIAELRG